MRRTTHRSDLPIRSNENGAIPPMTLTPGIETAGAYAAKDPSDIKSPHLPFGENVAVATGAS
jgi:poly(A) polymerase